MFRPVVFANRGEKIVGILHVPGGLKSGRKAPGIVMFHGFTGNRTEAHRLFVHVARALCSLGFAVLRFDFRGSGDSEGEFEDTTLPGEVDDGRRAISFLSRQRFVDRSFIGVLGLSMGGRVAAILAAEDSRVRFAVLYSPALASLRERMFSLIPEGERGKLESGEAVEVSPGWYLRKSFFETVDYVVPLEVLGRIRIPVLIVHGDRDQVIPVEEAVKGYEALKSLNEKNELYIVRGGDHTFSKKEHTREVVEKTVRWLGSILNLSP